jgi:hypothetical protein
MVARGAASEASKPLAGDTELRQTRAYRNASHSLPSTAAAIFSFRISSVPS